MTTLHQLFEELATLGYEVEPCRKPTRAARWIVRKPATSEGYVCATKQDLQSLLDAIRRWRQMGKRRPPRVRYSLEQRAWYLDNR